MSDLEKKIASYLLEIEAIFLRPKEPFTWASGIKSPIYCDNRIILSFPEVRKEVETALVKTIVKHYPSCEAVIGTSTAGIPHAAIVADIMNLPMAYVRNFEKTHGRKNVIEGKIKSKSKVIVVEDLISTGGSSIYVANALRENDIDVLGIVSIFTYGLKSSKINLEKNNLVSNSLSNYDVLIKLALDQKKIDENDFKLLINFKNQLDFIDFSNA